MGTQLCPGVQAVFIVYRINIIKKSLPLPSALFLHWSPFRVWKVWHIMRAIFKIQNLIVELWSDRTTFFYISCQVSLLVNRSWVMLWKWTLMTKGSKALIWQLRKVRWVLGVRSPPGKERKSANRTEGCEGARQTVGLMCAVRYVWCRSGAWGVVELS